MQLLPPRDGEKQLSKIITIQYLKRAGFITCLFLCTWSGRAQSTGWINAEQLSKPYTLALNLQLEEARKQLTEIKTHEQIYIASLADALELLITENEVKFEKYEDAYEARLDVLEKNSTPESLFALAELRLQWAFIYLKFGHEFDAAWNVRQAYLTVQECKEKNPSFLPIKKSSGLLEIMLGSVPEKYQWVMSMLNMEGSIQTGLAELEQVRTQSKTLQFETTLLYYLFQGFVLQQTDAAMMGFDATIQAHADNPLALFLGASMAIKNSQSEKALTYLKKINESPINLSIPYSHYQLGEVYLHKGDYQSSIRSYEKFLSVYRGKNFVKDAHYKIGICYWITGSTTEAHQRFEYAKKAGMESAEADKYAARSLAEGHYPNGELLRIRYATDGGYYEEAKKLISNLVYGQFTDPKEKTEFTYRQARLAHKTGAMSEAKTLYMQTIEMQGDQNWYFAPNACLQLGYLLADGTQPAEAKKYFEKALTYKKHEYKNSIDSKAKSALAQLKKK